MWAKDPGARILMIAPTAADVREVMIEGPSGLLQCFPPNERPVYNSSRHLVSFPSGAVGITRSADEPERLRGPQFTKFWADEICAWKYVDEAWTQLSFGFRLKTARLQGIITTTPKPLKRLKTILKDPGTVLTRGSSYENQANISEQFYTEVIAAYEGTRIGRQEINAEILEDTEGALWTRQLIEANRVPAVPHDVTLIRIVVAIDPAMSAKPGSNETGIIAAGLGTNGHVYVIEDGSLSDTPGRWALAALGMYGRLKADRVVAEVNNGGDLVEANLRAQVMARGFDGNLLPYRSVRASRGKAMRAEPVAALYERGRVHHVGAYPKLEDQMCEWVPGEGMASPDRLDALVWALFDLVVQPHNEHVVTVQP